jgi:hypothetical protein
MPSRINILSWSDFLSREVQAGTSITLEFPSHLEDVFERLTSVNGKFNDLCDAIKQHVDQGVNIILAHNIRRETCPLLPDLVRFIDDRFPAIERLKLIISEQGHKL